MIFTFEGQGSVSPGMAREEYISHKRFRYYFDYINSLVIDITGYDVTKLCWGENSFQLRNNPFFAHLSLLVSSGALFKSIVEKGYKPCLLMGHSLGELLSYIWSETISLEDGVRFIALRGELFLKNADKVASEMMALIGERKMIEKFINTLKREYEVYVANDNSNTQVVISYNKKDENVIIKTLSCFKLKGVVLGIRNGCHSPFIKEIEKPLNDFIENIHVKSPLYKIYSSSFLKFLSKPEEIKLCFKRHLLAPVCWREAIKKIYNGDPIVVVGFSKVMKGLVLENISHADILMGATLIR